MPAELGAAAEEGLLPELAVAGVLPPAKDPAAVGPLLGSALVEEAGEDAAAPAPKGLLMGLPSTLSRGVAFRPLTSPLSDGLEDARAGPGVGLTGPALLDAVGFAELLLPLLAEGAGLRLALSSTLLETDAAGFEAVVVLAVPAALLFVAGTSSLIPSKALLICASRSPRSLRSSLM